MSAFVCLRFDVDKPPIHFDDYDKDLIQLKLENMLFTTLRNGPKPLCSLVRQTCADGVALWDWT